MFGNRINISTCNRGIYACHLCSGQTNHLLTVKQITLYLVLELLCDIRTQKSIQIVSSGAGLHCCHHFMINVLILRGKSAKDACVGQKHESCKATSEYCCWLLQFPKCGSQKGQACAAALIHW